MSAVMEAGISELGSLTGRIASLSTPAELVHSGSGLPDGPQKETVVYDLMSTINLLANLAEAQVELLDQEQRKA